MPRLIVRDRPQLTPLPQSSGATRGEIEGRALQRLGQQVSQFGSVLKASSDQRARRNAAQASVELRAEMENIKLDPDIEGREEKFNEARRRIEAKYKPGFLTGSPSEFNFGFGLSSEQLQTDLTAQTNRDAINRSRADLQFELNLYAQDAATSDNPDSRFIAEQKGELAISRGLSDGTISQGDADTARRGFNKTIDSTLQLQFENYDPAGGLEFLNSPEFNGTEAERQVGLRRMRTAYQHELASNLKISEQSDKAQKKIDEQLQEATINKWIGVASDPESPGVPLVEVQAASRGGFLTTAEVEKWTGIARSGGHITPSVETDPRAFSSLRKRAMDGTDGTVVAEATRLYEDGRLTIQQLTTIETLSGDSRFGGSLAVLESAVDAALAYSGGAPGVVVMAEQSVQEMAVWISEHPNATRGEAMRQAKTLYSEADVNGVIENTIPQKSANRYIRDSDDKIDIKATLEHIARERLAGRLPEAEMTEIKLEMDDMSENRRADAAARSRMSGAE